jgi:ATP-dependent helicase HrpA
MGRSPRDIPVPRFDADLPVLARRAEIERAIRDHRAVVVCGATGSGKTTQLPQIALGAGRGREGMIAHTQPRRIAARAVAARIAEELGVPLGGAVGVKVRFNDRTSERTVLKLMTDGMLLAETGGTGAGGDPRLLAYDTVIIDEAHERSLNIDFLLGYLRRLLEVRDDLKVIITSATIDPGRFSDHFGGPARCPVIEVSGRTYPIDVRYRPGSGRDDDAGDVNPRAIADAVGELLSPRVDRGDVLVFLPGEREIRIVADAVRREGLDAEILPLFARLSASEQDRIFHPSANGRRRVILATNVAETSLTVPGIRHVVDTGLARISRYDPATKVQRLPVEPISRASADQRAGRCGRLGPGVCVRLFDESSYAQRPRFTDPEIRRTNLASVLLRLLSLGLGSIDDFPFLDPPDAHAVKDARETLFELGAVTSREPDATLTKVGRRLARIPVDPRIGRMILGGADEGSLREVLVLAAALSIQDPRERPPGGRQDDADRAHAVFRNETSDFLTLLNIWVGFAHVLRSEGGGGAREWCRQNSISHVRMREWLDTHEQLVEIAEELDLAVDDPAYNAPATPDQVHRALLTGLISNVACRLDAQSFDYRGVRGNAPVIFPGSVLFKKAPRWIMAGEVVQTTRLFARTVAKIEPEWVEELAGHMFQRQLSDKHFDAATGEPSAWERVSMSGVVVVPRRRVALAPHDPDGARKLFIADGLARGQFRPESALARHNTSVLAAARQAEAKVRRRGVVVDDRTLIAWFEARVPPEVVDPVTFDTWYPQASGRDPGLLKLTLADVLTPDAAAAADESMFPSRIPLEHGHEATLSYALAPGKDDDGITATLGLLALPLLTSARAEWLVPGVLADKLLTLIKQAPKEKRTRLEAAAPAGGTPALVEQAAQLMTFGAGDLCPALSEAVSALTGVEIAPDEWPMKAVPAHQRLRVRVVDERGAELAVDRDLAKLAERLAPKLAKARAAAARTAFERSGITSWDFGPLPERVENPDAPDAPSSPTLVDETDSVRLTLAPDAEGAAALTHHGVRRLFALACRDEVHARLDAAPALEDMARAYRQLGEREELVDHLTLLIAEKTFMLAQAPVRDAVAFEERLTLAWGRLAQGTFDVVEAVRRTLEARAVVAKRFSGGTPRLWATSVADIREHAAYLFPAGFLALAGWERIREYPRYAEGMRSRLLTLREDGKGSETSSLATFGPHWKRFTGWAAQRMAEQRAAQESAPGDPARAKKPPLPRARRAAPSVNLEAGDWAMQPGHLTKAALAYRWALEEHRLALFAPDLSAGATFSAKKLDELWAKVGG